MNRRSSRSLARGLGGVELGHLKDPWRDLGPILWATPAEGTLAVSADLATHLVTPIL